MSEFEIFKEVKNPLFNRNEVEMKIKSKNTPERKKVLEFLSSRYSSPKDAICVESIKGSFGSEQFKIIARIYSSKEEKNFTEARSKKEIEKEKKSEEVAEGDKSKEEIK